MSQDHIKVDGCRGFDQPHMNASYAIIGSYLQEAVKRRGTGPVVYHPSNLGFEYPRQFRELAAIGNQWRFQTDVQDSWWLGETSQLPSFICRQGKQRRLAML